MNISENVKKTWKRHEKHKISQWKRHTTPKISVNDPSKPSTNITAEQNFLAPQFGSSFLPPILVVRSYRFRSIGVHPLYGGLTSRTHTHTRPVYNHTVILVRSVPWWLCCATTPEYMCWESLVGSWCLCWCVWTTRWPVHTESMGTPVHRVHDTR